MLASVEKLALRRASSCVCIFSLEPLKLLHELLRCIALTLRGLPSKGASTHQESFRLSCGAALRRAVSARYTVQSRAQSSSARESEARTRCLPHTGTLLCNTSYYISTWVWIPVIVQLYKYEYLLSTYLAVECSAVRWSVNVHVPVRRCQVVALDGWGSYPHSSRPTVLHTGTCGRGPVHPLLPSCRAVPMHGARSC